MFVVFALKFALKVNSNRAKQMALLQLFHVTKLNTDVWMMDFEKYPCNTKKMSEWLSKKT